MTAEEIKQLKKDFGRPTELWHRAFSERNREVTKNNTGHAVSMNCRSCWFKVLKYHEEKATA